MSTIKSSRAYKTELNPNNTQISMFWRHVGAARYIYNWGLEQREEAYNLFKAQEWIDEHYPIDVCGDEVVLSSLPFAGHGLSFYDQSALLTEFKHAERNRWLNDISAWTSVAALNDVDNAYQNFYDMMSGKRPRPPKRKKKRRKDGKPDGYPQFKHRSNHGSFHAAYQNIKIEPDRIRLSKFGWIRLKERNYLPLDAHVNSVTISEEAGRWFVSIQVNETRPVMIAPPHFKLVGVDIGVTNSVTLSSGEMRPALKPLERALRKLRRLNKELDRRKRPPGQQRSANYDRTQQKIARLHYRIKMQRKDFLHKIINELCENYTDIFVEDFDVSSVIANTESHEREGRRNISDSAMGMLRSILKYKGPWLGKRVYLAEVGENFASNRMCSRCGYVIPTVVKNKKFKCPHCHYLILRQLNTCHNLMTVASSLEETLNAWGDAVIPETFAVKVFDRMVNVRLVSANHAPSRPPKRGRKSGTPKGAS